MNEKLAKYFGVDIKDIEEGEHILKQDLSLPNGKHNLVRALKLMYFLESVPKGCTSGTNNMEKMFKSVYLVQVSDSEDMREEHLNDYEEIKDEFIRIFRGPNDGRSGTFKLSSIKNK